MPAHRHPARLWFAGFVAIALVLIGAASGLHAGSWRNGPTHRVSAGTAAATPTHSARVADLGPGHAHVTAPQLLDPATPPEAEFFIAQGGRQVGEFSFPTSRVVAEVHQHPGRAPPAV